jgi:hypothetical protein
MNDRRKATATARPPIISLDPLLPIGSDCRSLSAHAT